MREMSVAEQRYQAVLAEGETVKDVAARWRVSRQTLHTWLARYEPSAWRAWLLRSRRPGSGPQHIG
jgi:transposase